MDVKKILRDYQGLILSVSIILVSGLGFILGIIPIIQKTIGMNNDYAVQKKEVEVLRNKITLLDTLDEDSMRNDLKTLLSAVPSDKSFSTLLGTLDGLSAQTGVSIGTLSLTKPGTLSTASAERLSADEQAAGSNILPFTASILGPFEQIRTFIADSIVVRRLFRIRSFDISFSGDTIVSANVMMDTFYTPLPSTIGSVIQPITPLTNGDTELIAKIAAMRLVAGTLSPLPPPSTGPAKSDPFSL